MYSRGGKFDDLRVIADPIIAYLRLHFMVEVLVCLGANDVLVTHKPYKQIIDASTRFHEALTKDKQDDRDGDKYIITCKYMTLPFIPAISQLPVGDKHDLKNDTDRTKDIVFINRYLDAGLNAKNPTRPGLPGLHTLGISNDPVDNFYPSFNKHIFSHWEYPHPLKKDLTKNFRKTRDVIHFNAVPKTNACNRIHKYFYHTKYGDLI